MSPRRTTCAPGSAGRATSRLRPRPRRSRAGMACAAGRAVIFDAENGPYVMGARVGGLEPTLPADRVAIYDAEGLRLDNSGDVAWMLDVIRRERANLFVLDSLRAMAGGAAE